MKTATLVPVIIAGGSGSRLWPLSRESYPKQFLMLDGNNTLLQSTILRLNDIACEYPLVVTNEKHRFIVAEQLREINKLDKNIILEPCAKNTAPAVALAAMHAQKKLGQDPLLLILAADHLIRDEKAFCQAIDSALQVADRGKIITFGIVPGYAETGYGYIKRGINFTSEYTTFDDGYYVVDRFVEKPEKNIAEEYVSSGNYYWNSGMFLVRASVYLEELNKFRPDIYKACQDTFMAAFNDLDFVRLPNDKFSACPSDSIDYAVMEKTSRCLVCPLDIGWSDIGSWQSLWEVSEKTQEGNVHYGDVYSFNSNNNYVNANSALVATIGVNDLVIVQTKDSVLVANKDDAQSVKDVVERLKQKKRTEYFSHPEVYRPWGRFEMIDQSENYAVKKIIVKRGEGLSFRMHHYRSEHWIVVSGVAVVTIEGKKQTIASNESIYIPKGVTYSLENPGVIPLYLIEVSSGDYLGEDDIVRQKERY